MIEEQVEWLTPAAMVSKVQTAYPRVTSKQVHRAWRELSQTYWRRDELQLPSARKLLTEYPEEVDLFHVNSVLEDVELLAWCYALFRLASQTLRRLRGKLKTGIHETMHAN